MKQDLFGKHFETCLRKDQVGFSIYAQEIRILYEAIEVITTLNPEKFYLPLCNDKLVVAWASLRIIVDKMVQIIPDDVRGREKLLEAYRTIQALVTGGKLTWEKRYDEFENFVYAEYEEFQIVFRKPFKLGG